MECVIKFQFPTVAEGEVQATTDFLGVQVTITQPLVNFLYDYPPELVHREMSKPLGRRQQMLKYRMETTSHTLPVTFQRLGGARIPVLQGFNLVRDISSPAHLRCINYLLRQVAQQERFLYQSVDNFHQLMKYGPSRLVVKRKKGIIKRAECFHIEDDPEEGKEIPEAWYTPDGRWRSTEYEYLARMDAVQNNPDFAFGAYQFRND